MNAISVEFLQVQTHCLGIRRAYTPMVSTFTTNNNVLDMLAQCKDDPLFLPPIYLHNLTQMILILQLLRSPIAIYLVKIEKLYHIKV